MPLAAAVGLGVALRFLVPIPAGITVQAWSLLSIFVSAIVGEAGMHWSEQCDALHRGRPHDEQQHLC